MASKEPIGVIPESGVHPLEQRVPRSVIEGFEAIGDLTGTISDVLDDLGIVGTIPASTLRSTMPGRRIIGSALTLRHDPLRHQPVINSDRHISRMAEIEAHNLAEPGDVLVIQGVPDVSGIGGISATIGKRQGEIGAVVDGGIRDIDYQRSIEYPIWSSSVSPVTGKWRVATTEVNGPVRIQGILVNAGDLVVADDTGVCFVPADVVEEVLLRCQAIVEKETKTHDSIASGMPVAEIAETLRRILQPSDPEVETASV